MKIILIIIDGLGDESIPALAKKTPLEAAKTPNLDFLAKNGICGQVLPYYQEGQEPSSEHTHLALFGYQPKTANPGRGVLEALGIEAEILLTDVCLRGNFASVDQDLKIIDRRAGRITETGPLIESLNKIKIRGVRVLVKKGLSHRVVVILRGKDLSEKISDGDIKKANIKPPEIKAKTKKAKFTARILQEFLKKANLVLKEHPLNKKREKQGKLPANYILVRGAGKMQRVQKFSRKYGLRTYCVAGGPLYKGIARYLGMEVLEAKGDTGLVSTNLKEKFLTVKRILNLSQNSLLPKETTFSQARKHDLTFCHIKAADTLAESGDFKGKLRFIEKIDREMKNLFNPLKNFCLLRKANFEDTLIIVTADHSTCSLKKSHCKNPIPLLIFGAERDKVQKFSEKACKKGKLGEIDQIHLMKTILRFAT